MASTLDSRLGALIMSYKIIKNFYGEQIQRTSDGAYIPEDLNNKDYVEYKEWVDEGNTAPKEIRYP